MSVKCPKCNTDNPDTQKFCGECATPLPSLKEIPVTETLETPKEELTTGFLFAGRYQIIEELGKGGMGKVYRALDKKLNEEVALKLIKPEIASDKKTLERFNNELKFARKIAHKNVGRMYELMEEKGTHYITMEYVPGQDLRGLIRQSGQLAVGTAVSIAKQVCDGLTEAHRLGVIHRDLKPQNVMIDRDGNARIMDFGIARSLKAKGITGAGVMVGTPEYMSPEQVESKEVDQCSDIYSLGVILYEMVTGRVPFEGDTPLSVAVKHKTESPPNPKEINTQIPEDLSRLILNCLEKGKEKRCQSAGEVRSELENIEKGIPTTEKIIPKRKPITSKEITVQFSMKRIFIPIFVIIAVAVIWLIIWRPWVPRELPPPTTEKPSIAILPFDDSSPEKDQEHLCNGLAESIINALMKVKGLRVPAKTSSFSLKEKGSAVQEIGERLKVDTILEGSVQKSGDRIRISAWLVNVADESVQWSEQWNKDLGDMFAVQDEIALAVVDKLKVHLGGKEREAVTKHYTDNVEAYNLYLLGRHFWNERTEESNKKAIEYFDKAIDLDPNYALAHAGLADSYIVAAGYFYLPSKEALSKAKNVVMKALELDDTLSEAYTTLAALKSDMDWDWEGAEEAYLQAIKFNVNNATAHHWYSYFLSNMGRHEEAIKEAKRAQELDPLSHIMSRGLGGVYLNARQYEQAIEELKRAIEFGSKSYFGHLWLFYAYYQSKLYSESIGVLKEFANLMGFSDQKALIEEIYTESGYSAALRQVIPMIPDPFHIATFFVLLGENDQAFEWLEKAYKENSVGLGCLKELSIFDSVRSDARFKELLKKINLE